MFKEIKSCSNCVLCKNQPPLLDYIGECNVFWVGLSAKKITFENEKPLSKTTNSGRLLAEVEEGFRGVFTYKTNLVKCVPLNENSKLRYPNKKEIQECFPNLEKEIEVLKPKIVFLLGSKVTKAVESSFNIKFESWNGFTYKYVEHDGVYYVSIHHPSYVHIYKRKDKGIYISNIRALIEEVIFLKKEDIYIAT